MRVGVIAIQHESNTFLASPTTLADFQREILVSGNELLAHYAGGHHEVTGFLDGARQNGINAIPIFAAWTVPGGTVTAHAADALMAQMTQALDRAGYLDGLLVAPHGAAVAENYPDFDGQWLALLRQRLGAAIPIVCTLDLHAGVSQRMINCCDATIAYRTNPHLDQRQRGIEAAELMARILRSEILPTQAVSWPPVLINIERQLSSESPCKDLYAAADQQLQRSGALSNSVVLGFPYADVEEMGPAAIVVTNNDVSLAQYLADELAGYVVQHRHEFLPDLISVDSALEQAERCRQPVCLLDVGDNVGGGSPADGTVLASAIHHLRLNRAFVCLYDPESVNQSVMAGAGSVLEMRLGGKTDNLHGAPIVDRFVVRSIHGGVFTEPQARHGGKKSYNMGRTAIVESHHGMTIMLTSLRTPPFSLQQLISCGLAPQTFRMIVAKGVHAPVAAYREVCKTFIRVNTPGATTADVARLRYHHRRRPMFPFESID